MIAHILPRNFRSPLRDRSAATPKVPSYSVLTKKNTGGLWSIYSISISPAAGSSTRTPKRKLQWTLERKHMLGYAE